MELRESDYQNYNMLICPSLNWGRFYVLDLYAFFFFNLLLLFIVCVCFAPIPEVSGSYVKLGTDHYSFEEGLGNFQKISFTAKTAR